MANDNTIGSVLVIPDSLLNKMDDVDNKLIALQNNSKKTADVWSEAFKEMAGSTDALKNVLSSIQTEFEKTEGKAKAVSSAISSIDTSNIQNAARDTGSLGGSITSAAQSAERLRNALSNGDEDGSGNFQKAAMNLERMEAAFKNASGLNIAGLEQEISAINKTLKDSSSSLTKEEQERLTERKAMLQDELREQRRTIQERKIAHQQALDAMAKAEEAFNKKRAKAEADLVKSKNTTYDGALDFAKNADSVKSRTQAIKNLIEARSKLSLQDDAYKEKLRELNAEIKRLTRANNEATAATQKLKTSHNGLEATAIRLAEKFAVLYSVQAAQNFFSNIVSVRGELEMSQRSLEAILQNKTQADEIFNKTVQLAIKSPFQIKDLVDFTRQLSAYRIESDKLYDTTKRLADVSAGLGVDMGRLILAYGQVKAAAYLRGSEVRQFTEAGINMYGELQSYFKEVKGEAYTTAQIVDMISRKKVSFEDVEAVFQRMTDKGGVFYRMQEIQAETLQGKIANLKDSFDVMFNAIGKENEGALKGLITGVTSLLGHWQGIMETLRTIIILVGLLKLKSLAVTSVWRDTYNTLRKENSAFVSFFKLMGIEAGKAATALERVGESIGNAWKSIAATAIIELAWKYFERVSKVNEALRAANNEYVKTKSSLIDLRSEFDKVANSEASAFNGDKADKMRASLQKLIEQMNKEGMEVKINVEQLDEKGLKKQYNKLEKEADDFAYDMMRIRKNAAKNTGSWLTDDINENARDYNDAAVDILSSSRDIEHAINSLKVHYGELTERQKKYYEQIRDGKKDSETQLEYLDRSITVLARIRNLSPLGANIVEEAVGGNKRLFNLFGYTRDLENEGEKFKRQVIEVFGDLKRQGLTTMEIKARIDKYAIEKEWSAATKELAYRTMGVPIVVQVDKKNTEKEVSWLDQYIADFFKNHSYGVNLNVKKIDDKDALKNYLTKGNDVAKAAKNYEEVIKRLQRSLANKGVNDFVFKLHDGNKEDDELKTLLNLPSAQESIKASEAIQRLIKLKNAATREAKEVYGVDPFEKQGKKVLKTQNDLYKQRIALLKEMNSMYERLAKYSSSAESAKKVKEQYDYSIKALKMGKFIDVSTFIPDRAGTKKAVENVARYIKEAKDRNSAMQDAGKIGLEIDEKDWEKSIEAAKRKAEEIFNGLDLYKSLKGVGLDDSTIKRMFGDIATGFADAKKRLEEIYKGKEGEEWVKAFANYSDKLLQKQYDDRVKEASDIIKTYKTNLEERLQLDMWYAQERGKILLNSEIANDPEAQQVYLKNLQSEYNKKSAELDWKEFKDTPDYVTMFDNLDLVSSNVLERMREKLVSIKDSLSDLSPEQLKTIQQQISKIEEKQTERNPFKNAGKYIKEYIKGLAEVKQAEKDFEAQSNATNAALEKKKELEATIKKLSVAYESMTEEQKNSSEGRGIKSQLDETLRKHEALTDEYDKQETRLVDIIGKLRDYREATSKVAKMIKKVSDALSTLASLPTDVASSLENVFGTMDSKTRDSVSSFAEIASGLSTTGEGIARFIINPGDISAYATAVSGLAKTVGAIFSIGDKKKERKIQRLKEQIDALAESYTELHEKMQEAFKGDVSATYKEAASTIEKRSSMLQEMINAESSKKKSDSSKIKEWEKEQKELLKQMRELQAEYLQELGGFGSNEQYKTAAQKFTDAWLDAYGQGSSTLDALNDKFDDVMENIAKKQVMQRFAGRFIEPMLKQIDDALVRKDGTMGSIAELRNALESIRAKWPEAAETFNTIAKEYADLFGITSSSDSSLSALQQGIQGISEQTSQALESLLNSIRFFASTEQQDVAAIRQMLQERFVAYTGNGNESNPMLAYLSQQLVYTSRIYTLLDSVTMPGHPKGRSGIRIYMD